MRFHRHHPLNLRALGALSLLAISALTGCPGGGGTDAGHDAGPASLVPADYRTRFTVVRNCRSTAEHTNPLGDTTNPLDAHGIIVYVNPESADAYLNNANPLPTNTLVIKEEHTDNTCSELLGYSVMHKEAGFDSAHGDWHWQHLNAAGNVERDGIVQTCIGQGSCHTAGSCVPRDFMCTQP